MPDEEGFLLPEEEPEEDRFGDEADATAQARTLTDRLLKGIEQGERDYIAEPLGIHLADVEASVERFGFQLRFCKEFGEAFPCLQSGDEDPVPIDFLGLYGPTFWPYMEPYWFELPHMARVFFREWFEKPWWSLQFRLSEHKPSEAKGFFGGRLVGFLAARFSASRWSAAASPGLQFKVLTQNHGLRVHYSPAYFFNPWNVFGSTTSHVYGDSSWPIHIRCNGD
jgi:hypothetical protein